MFLGKAFVMQRRVVEKIRTKHAGASKNDEIHMNIYRE